MLSYQHSFHAGNLADVHKHSLLAWMLCYLTRKDKPLCYIETHAGRGTYNLDDPDARKTGEAAQGVVKLHARFHADHPYAQTVSRFQHSHGGNAYPGSPAVAAAILRPQDNMHFAELHPGEFARLQQAIPAQNARFYKQDGFSTAYALCPPTPRRGLLLVDPSYEVKNDYTAIPKHFEKLTKAWNVGILCLWYPILKDSRHLAMRAQLQKQHPDSFTHEVLFPPAKDGHGMVGSGMFVVRPPFGTQDAAAEISAVFTTA